MRFALSAAAALVAFVSSAVAQNPDFNPVYKPAANEEIPAGSSYKIEWSTPEKYAGVTIKIALIGGETQNTQVPLLDIASGIANSDKAYTWDIPADIGGKKFYGLVLTSEENAEDWQYSNPFVITAGEDSGSDAPSYGSGSSTVVVTTSVGTATVTLSAAETTSEVAVNTTSSCIETTSELPEPTTSVVVVVNSTTPASVPVAVPTTHSTLVVAASSTVAIVEQPTESVPVVVPESGAVAQAKAGLFAVLGGLAVAALL